MEARGKALPASPGCSCVSVLEEGQGSLAVLLAGWARVAEFSGPS